MTYKLTRYIVLLLPVILIISACAKVGSSATMGGPKDYDPPVMVSSNPPKYSTNFQGKKIEITFDEFIELKDVNTKGFVSPPMKKKPNIVRRNKSIIINLEEDLKPYTTYRFAFGDAVVDLNESNPIDNFDFVVSTSGIVDSLSLHGQVVSSFDHTPDEDGLFVMLYDQFHDTIPRKQLPSYLTKTNPKGYFSFNNVRPDTFMILAVKDANMNYLFDTPTEKIAYSDTLIALENYTIPKDSIVMDTVKVDSLKRIRKVPKPQITMYSFTEDFVKQSLDKSDRSKPNRFDLFFARSLTDSVQIEPLNFWKPRGWLLADKPIFNDTLNFWITDTSLVRNDTLKLRIGYHSTDSLGKVFLKSDTIKLVNKKLPGAKTARKSDDKTKKVEYVQISSSTEGKSTVDLNTHVILEAGAPIDSIDITKISVFTTEEIPKKKEKEEDKDAVTKKKNPVKFTLWHDSIYLRKYHLKFAFEPNTEYNVTFDSIAFRDIYGLYNDSTGFIFKTQKDDYYGKIQLSVSNVKEPLIFQLITEKEEIVQQKFISKDQDVIFDFLAPSKYKVKVIYDRNNNQTWDTGNLEKKLQPEKVIYYKDVISVRANWDVNLIWKVE